ncbi:helix-turn-helix transcriptional regulator [Actinoallomurus vinaceus]|uniref:Helix-turn-helix transcriptional regulator n=1 Tax=Actinoallomurus vinaceus TaxID=1080074 RepID=A0ABP8UHY8_9ACTN
MSLRHAVLGLLSEGPASGYDLLKIFEISLANVWPATQSQLYGELGRLADAGFVTVVAEGPRGRKEYAITDAGRAELHRWLVEVEPTPVARRSDMLLRVFFLGVLEPEEARTYLRRRAEAADENHRNLSELRKVVSEGEDSLSVYGRMALEWGLRFTATQRDWAEWAEQELDRIRKPQGASES